MCEKLRLVRLPVSSNLPNYKTWIPVTCCAPAGMTAKHYSFAGSLIRSIWSALALSSVWTVPLGQ